MLVINYKRDDALEFLKYCSNDELNFFVELYKNEAKMTELLTEQNEYKKYAPEHSKYWDLIAGELQYFGGNTAVNLSRRGGVLYKEILCDVCEKEFISYDKDADVAQIEKIFVFEYLKKNIKSMNDRELKDFKKNINSTKLDVIELINHLRKKIFNDREFFQNITTSLLSSLGKSILQQTIKIALPFVTKRIISVPFGIALSVKEVFDPAFRITLPSVIYIAYLREKYKSEDLQFRRRFYPKIGSILRTELAGNMLDHSGICISKNEIIEVFNNDGQVSVKKVTYDEFVNSSLLRTGTTIYIAVDQLSKDIICSTKIAKNAIEHLNKVQEYKLIKNNCHSFVHKCIKSEKFESTVEIVKFKELTKSISSNLNNNRSVDWMVCDINPKEYKKFKKWKIEDEVV